MQQACAYAYLSPVGMLFRMSFGFLPSSHVERTWITHVLDDGLILPWHTCRPEKTAKCNGGPQRRLRRAGRRKHIRRARHAGVNDLVKGLLRL